MEANKTNVIYSRGSLKNCEMFFFMISGTERYHSSKQYVLEHTGKLKKRMFSGGCMGKKQTYHDCCDRDKG